MFTATSVGSLCAAIAMQKARRQETVTMRLIETPRVRIVASISRFWRFRERPLNFRSEMFGVREEDKPPKSDFAPTVFYRLKGGPNREACGFQCC